MLSTKQASHLITRGQGMGLAAQRRPLKENSLATVVLGRNSGSMLPRGGQKVFPRRSDKAVTKGRFDWHTFTPVLTDLCSYKWSSLAHTIPGEHCE